MDYNDANMEPWDWQGMDYCLSKEPTFDLAPSIWDGVITNQEDISYIFDEATPIKACADLPHHYPNGNVVKESSDCRLISSQGKRRRTLQFSPQSVEPTFCTENLSREYPDSQDMENSNEDALLETLQWTCGSPGCEDQDHSSDGWVSECLNDAEMDCSPDGKTSDSQVDISELCNNSRAHEAKGPLTWTRQKLIPKGRKSYIRTPTKLTSSVVYPFAFIKPCGVHGDVTLKDINQRIRTPPPSKSKKNDEDATGELPTSAFSGKPVVGKTKIRTEGGQGSITIMRTRG